MQGSFLAMRSSCQGTSNARAVELVTFRSFVVYRSASAYITPWCRYYPYHYAPLVSDLAKNTGAIARLKTGGVRRDGGADSWAPPHGPVRPLVQLMAVLPPRR